MDHPLALPDRPGRSVMTGEKINDGEPRATPPRRNFLYPVPEGFQVMLAVVNSLQGDEKTEVGWSRHNGCVVALSSITAAIYLRAEFTHRPADIHGQSLLEDHEIWVEDENRHVCERMLAENCPCSAKWFDVIEVSFATDDEHRAFGAAYTAITGLPNVFSALPTPS